MFLFAPSVTLNMRWLLLGAKEYPFGASAKEDPVPSGGMEKYAQDLAEELALEGDDVHIITRKFATSHKPPKGVHVHHVTWMKGRLLRNPSFNFNSLFKAASLDFDVVLSQGVVATMAALVLRKIRGKPVIAVPAGIAHLQPQHGRALGKAIEKMERDAYSRADFVVFLSEQERRQFLNKMGFLPERHAVIPPGVKIESWKGENNHQEAEGKEGKIKKVKGGRSQKGDGAEEKKGKIKNREAGRSKKTETSALAKPEILFVGRLNKVKGAEYLLHAMRHVDATLRIVGNGPEEESLKALAGKLGLANVVFEGYYADPSGFYRRADVFVLPSLSEGLPLALLEASAHGLACVVTDIGLPVQNGKTALVVPAKDPAALAKALQTLVKNKGLRLKLGSNARKYALANYSWRKAARQLDALAMALGKGR